LAVEQWHPVQLDLAEVDAEDDDGATRGDQLDGPRQAGGRAGGLHHDVIQTVGAGACAQALAGLPLVGMACLEGDLFTPQTTRTGDGKEAEGAGADDCYALGGSGLGEPEG